MCLIFSSSVVQMKFKTTDVYLCVGLAQNLSVKGVISVAMRESPPSVTLSRCSTPTSGGCDLDPLVILGLCLFPCFLTQGNGTRQVSGVLHLLLNSWADLLPALMLRQKEKWSQAPC